MTRIKLSKISTAPPEKSDKETTKAATKVFIEELDELQNLLYAQHKHSVLVILQGMDASGKDGAVRNVLGQMNPLGVRVYPFKAPTQDELDHDFLWRVHAHVPAKGMIHVFNRSHYEDVLVQRVHKWVDEKTIQKRMGAINDFEKLLTEHNSTHILKFYLHVSREEQARRLQERTEDPRKMWKYNANDQKEALLWKQYRNAYEDVFEHCSYVPWHIVPADHNWYKEYLVAKTLRDILKKLKMKYPAIKQK
ncbi:MAG TPA: PPK2 family polyphosphate kinase [Chitinophaga sp.]|uniref:PPK2 family polyphosphate kinase n=1 Tax=Chitinophaga sp. TaxID=1869181 RepID=UPI002DB5817C|nr:PPK2 family polyphosphate kinase [Chitinophaga sp.]HEU4552874.1 PPK2 family polyphosphate kinase [Chitinophaga sp.]